MACPVVVGVIAASPAGLVELIRSDRRGRWITIALCAAYLLAWGYYFFGVSPIARSTFMRVALELLFVPLWIAGYLRLRWLMKTQNVEFPFIKKVENACRRVAPLVVSPSIWAVKILLIGMLLAEWQGLAQFSLLEYGVACILLCLMMLGRAYHLKQKPNTTTALSAQIEIHSAPTDKPAARCPFHFLSAATVSPQKPILNEE